MAPRGADGDGRRGLAFTWDCVNHFWQLRGETKLPRGTLLLVELGTQVLVPAYSRGESVVVGDVPRVESDCRPTPDEIA